ncbi:MAG: efflux RND transporter periplasmic adaptor subunit [Minisyncoccia bacterium]
MGKILNLLKQKKYLYYGLGAIIVVVGGFLFFNNKTTTGETLTISHSDFINQVYVSGKVVASEEVDMAFEERGKIERVYFEEGQEIKAGSFIAKIDAKEAEKEVHDAEISLESAKLSLAKLKLESSEDNLNADLAKAYDEGLTAVSDAFVDLSVVITELEDVLNEDNLSDRSARASGLTAKSYLEASEKAYYEALNAFKENRSYFRLLGRNSPRSEIEKIIDTTYDTTKLFADEIKTIKNYVDYMADDSTDSSSFTESKNSLSDYADTASGHLDSLLSIKKDISDLKEAFPSAGLDIKDLELTVKQKENTLLDARKKLSDYYIRAPFDGVITKIDAKVGEITDPNTPLVTIMSQDTFQIESYVPEVNIALIKVGDIANVTLDAYGENVFFGAKVVSIDSAETVRDGISTYRIKLQFDNEDERIKSGMTANVSIIIFNKPNVIVVPGGVVFNKDGKKFIQIIEEKIIVDREVVLGEVSSLGQVEVVSGLTDGEMVVLNPNVE